MDIEPAPSLITTPKGFQIKDDGSSNLGFYNTSGTKQFYMDGSGDLISNSTVVCFRGASVPSGSDIIDAFNSVNATFLTFAIDGSGKIHWGAGSTDFDMSISRSTADFGGNALLIIPDTNANANSNCRVALRTIGTALTSVIRLQRNSDIANPEYIEIGSDLTATGFFDIREFISGSGVARPIKFSMTGTEVLRFQTATPFVKFNEGSTGAGSAALGANCPAVTVTAPYTWMKFASADGSTVFVPAWK